ncbi:MAG: hypothetical protein LBF33_02880 [Oscillospiraceae bacterium]|nr:hypothetical protein [Oscillospiraceae bacterium]
MQQEVEFPKAISQSVLKRYFFNSGIGFSGKLSKKIIVSIDETNKTICARCSTDKSLKAIYIYCDGCIELFDASDLIAEVPLANYESLFNDTVPEVEKKSFGRTFTR